jgi:hypothetical protein
MAERSFLEFERVHPNLAIYHTKDSVTIGFTQRRSKNDEGEASSSPTHFSKRPFFPSPPASTQSPLKSGGGAGV